MKGMFFPKRIPEPKIMEKAEFDVFEKLSFQHHKTWLIPFIDDLFIETNLKNGKILDVGCGPGMLIKEFAHQFRDIKVFGIDTSSYALKLARKNCKALKNIIIKNGDVHNLPFPDQVFDFVTCKDSLHHFKNISRALKEMLRVLKIGGFIYLQDLRRDLPMYLLKRAIPPDTILKKLQFYSTRAAYTKNELKEIFRKLRIKNYVIKTKKLTPGLKMRYLRKGITPQQLKEGFQARLTVIIKKNF